MRLTALLLVLLLAGVDAIGMGRATGPRLKGLSTEEQRYAQLYWDYNSAERVLNSSTGPALGMPDHRLGYEFAIGLPERLAGITYVGHAARLRLVLERVRQGEAVRLAALGGSITCGQGAGGPDLTYAAIFANWLNAAMPPRQPPAAPPCLQHHLPPGVELVMVEYAVNDSPTPSPDFLDPDRRAFERLLRKVLRLPSRPAVLLVNMFALQAARGRYWHSAERDFMDLATYYGLPSVSLRAAVLPTATAASLLASSTSSSSAAATASAPASWAPEVALAAIFNSGKHHPGRGGHVVAAELLITLAQELLLANDRMAAAAAPADATSGADGAGGSAVVRLLSAVASRPLPPPLSDDNYEAASSTCYIEHQLQAIVQEPAVGWNWTDEGRRKWGWVALEVGQQLRIRVNTQVAGERQQLRGKPPPIVLQVSQHPRCVLLLTTTGPVANHTWGAAGAEGAEGAGPGAKFKLMGLVVGEEPGAQSGMVTWLMLYIDRTQRHPTRVSRADHF
ncbi:hypothetical protein TSOC_010906 [Tetrabaena socialis]|uniref:SGNH hydrolase-type esterase domain-containing protein n=1 Tax=Tetrabaena socialis TaxID=47790 RepID=A0A2J7ZS22_9CHLO|nr:hypothetical protein TSOC_010906 [Tetrabaena socialis]|eukprot:PNH03065.1 hypothetical protein TSOC_010906 [Tetrabaena socialis]